MYLCNNQGYNESFHFYKLSKRFENCVIFTVFLLQNVQFSYQSLQMCASRVRAHLWKKRYRQFVVFSLFFFRTYLTNIDKLFTINRHTCLWIRPFIVLLDTLTLLKELRCKVLPGYLISLLDVTVSDAVICSQGIHTAIVLHNHENIIVENVDCITATPGR